MEKQKDLFAPAITIDGTAKMHIRGIASWAMVIVVSTILVYVLSILDMVMHPAQPSATQAEGFTASILAQGQSTAGTIFTILVGLAVNYFLYRFARSITSSINGMSLEKFSSSFRSLKLYFAITTIILVLLLLLLLIAIVAFL